jgi:hypothetical protein
MTRDRWDETWHRLREWTNGQAPSERLAAQLLIFAGYEGVDPSHPLGGPDGGMDILCTKDGLRCLAAVYFPRGQQKLREIKRKFRGDIQKARSQQPPINRFVFVTNQELRLADREELRQAGTEVARDIEVHLYHLELITAFLDAPEMQAVRSQFLGIGGAQATVPVVKAEVPTQSVLSRPPSAAGEGEAAWALEGTAATALPLETAPSA